MLRVLRRHASARVLFFVCSALQALRGRWYACPNDHPYWVDKCGGPTEINPCKECGEPTGGLNHNLLPTNKDIGNVGKELFQTTVLADKSDRGYCIRDARGPDDGGDSRFATERSLSPPSLRIVRLLVHGKCN